MPSGGLYATYHLLREPKTTIEERCNSKMQVDASMGFTKKEMGLWLTFLVSVGCHSLIVYINEFRSSIRHSNPIISGWPLSLPICKLYFFPILNQMNSRIPQPLPKNTTVFGGFVRHHPINLSRLLQALRVSAARMEALWPAAHRLSTTVEVRDWAHHMHRSTP